MTSGDKAGRSPDAGPRHGARSADYPIAQVVALVAIFVYGGRSSLDGFGSKQVVDLRDADPRRCSGWRRPARRSSC